MKTVQMTLDEDLIHAVDKVTKRLHTTRSAFTRDALRLALKNEAIRRLEQRHRAGYQHAPASPTEFAVWEEEQDWGDE
jgi:metal-responsive CopG/Arc/MetJ family transcriptional regulator